MSDSSFSVALVYTRTNHVRLRNGVFFSGSARLCRQGVEARLARGDSRDHEAEPV